MKKTFLSSVTNRRELPAARALDPGELLNAREVRILELKRQIDAGTYMIDAYKIAVRMLGRAEDGREICPQMRC